jgi:3-oxoadipate CoA-transferase beta subunit
VEAFAAAGFKGAPLAGKDAVSLSAGKPWLDGSDCQAACDACSKLALASSKPVTLLPGGAFFHHADSFAMMRGGHIDICVLGAFQVSTSGDLANWSTGEFGAIPAVGGAMDLATGAAQTWVMMDLLTKQGTSKVVERCSYPLTGIGCVKRVCADLATFECTEQGLRLVDSVEGIGTVDLAALLGVPFAVNR